MTKEQKAAKKLWARIIFDAQWYDGSPQSLEKLIGHFEKQGYVISQLLQKPTPPEQ